MIGDNIGRDTKNSCFFVSLVLIVFIVKEITNITDPIQAISLNNNSITLPHDIFDNLPVKLLHFITKTYQDGYLLMILTNLSYLQFSPLLIVQTAL